MPIYIWLIGDYIIWLNLITIARVLESFGEVGNCPHLELHPGLLLPRTCHRLFMRNLCLSSFKTSLVFAAHDNSGMSPAWFLNKIIIDDSSTGRVYTFPCERWFAKDEDDGRISRELVAGKGDEGIPYTVKVFTGWSGGQEGTTNGKFTFVRIHVVEVAQPTDDLWLTASCKRLSDEGKLCNGFDSSCIQNVSLRPWLSLSPLPNPLTMSCWQLRVDQ